MNTAPGYFGKVVTHGDFVLRRMPPDFIDAWDRWLQEGMQHSRRALGADWTEVYLNSPIWRFSIGAGVCGAQAMGGVLMPGLDRFGRHFPWTLAAPVAERAAAASCVGAPAWFDTIEHLALDCVAPGFSLEALDEALTALGPPAVGARERAGVARFWTELTLSGAALAKSFQGMPTARDFSALLAAAG